MVYRLWPALLIIIGLDILFGRRSWIGSLISSLITLLVVGGLLWLLIVGPKNVQGIDWLTEASPLLQSKTIQLPLEGVEEASLNVHWGTGNQVLAALPTSSSSLLEGDVAYYNTLTFEVSGSGQRRDIKLGSLFSPEQWISFNMQPTDWELALHPAVEYRLRFESGSGNQDFDMSKLLIKHLEIESGSGRVRLKLPAGTYEALIDSGSGDTIIQVPKEVGVRLRVDQGSGDLYAPALKLVEGKERRRGTWESENFSRAADQITMEIDQGSGDVEITQR